MTAEECDGKLIQFLRNKPFWPFVVELIDGTEILIDSPALAVNSGGTLISEDYQLISFDCENVRQIRLATPESAR